MPFKSPLDRHMQTIHARVEMHKVIDELPDDCEALLLVHHKGDAKFIKYGLESWGDVNYTLDWFKHHIFNGDAEPST